VVSGQWPGASGQGSGVSGQGSGIKGKGQLLRTTQPSTDFAPQSLTPDPWPLL